MSKPVEEMVAPGYDVEAEVKERYAKGAEAAEQALCCPVDYDTQYLKILPQEIIERDYGCGDPSKWVGEGEDVLDLGSGGGKICYILSQKVGAAGKVIGVDVNDTMLGLARKYQGEIAEKVGYSNVEFRKGRIQDLKLSLDAAQAWLDEHPATDIDGVAAFEAECDRLRAEQPLIEDN
ncbi:MAG: methyltransferase domain-containing protein, partial [Planctomycetota bacterium]